MNKPAITSSCRFYNIPNRSFQTKRRLILLALSIVTMCFAYSAESQTTVGLDRLNGTYTTGIDNIDLASLAPHIDIPLYTKKVLGNGTDLVIKLTYDSDYFNPNIDGYYNADVGWRLGEPPTGSVISYLSSDEQCYPDPHPGNMPYIHHYGWSYRDTDGVLHTYAGDTITKDSPDCQSTQGLLDELPTDGAPYRLKANGINGSVILPSGGIVTPVYFGNAYLDSNGNLGGYYLLNSPNISNGSRSPLLISYKDSDGTTQTITVSYAMYPVLRGINYNAVIPDCVNHLPPPAGLIDKITFPDNSYYSFTYEDSTTCIGAKTGRLATIRVPTGGVIAYTYPSYMSYYDPGSFSTLTRTGPDGTTTYERVITGTESNGVPRTWTTKVNKLHSGSTPSDLTEITFVGGWAHRGIETSRKVYQGAGGTPLLETHRCYNGATGDCTNQLFYLPVTEIDETRSIDGNSSTRTDTHYNLAHLVTEVDEYDFGASSILRKTKTTYAGLGNDIADRPSNIQVTDGSDVKVKETKFSYDQYSVATPNGATPNRVDVTGDRGNLTQKQEWTGSSYLSTYYHYDEAGQVVSMTDGRGHTTSYLYDDATDTAVKKITNPATASNTIQHISSFEVNPNTLLPDAMIDENSVRTEYSYDSLLRLTTTKLAVGKAEENWKTTSYPSVTQITSSQDKDTKGDQAFVSSVTTDSFGRTSQNIRQISGGNVMVDTIYDELGRTKAQSTPYFGAAASGWTSYQYDALGRVIAQCQPDNGASYTTCDPTTTTGGVVLSTYDGATVITTDESGHSKKAVTDALGNLTDVYEDPSGANLHTQYGYDTLGNLLSVAQPGTSQVSTTDETARTARSYNYDSLSRLICASNPENSTAQCPTTAGTSHVSGTIGYAYDENGNVTLKTDARDATVTYGYDELNRLISKTAAGASSGTTSSCYSYDNGSAGASYFKGRLAQEWTQAGSCPSPVPASTTMQTRRFIQTYDAMGQIKSEQRCVWTSCINSTPITLTHEYDLASNMTKYDTGVGTLSVTNHFDAGARLDSVKSSVFNGTIFHPESLYKVTGFHPMGTPTAFDLGTAMSVTKTYDSRLRPTGLTATTK